MSIDHDRMRRVRMALHDDAIACRDDGWSAAEWEDRVLHDGIIAALYEDRAQLEREVDAFSRAVWGLR